MHPGLGHVAVLSPFDVQSTSFSVLLSVNLNPSSHCSRHAALIDAGGQVFVV